jgi:hypothetical protein
MSQQWLAKKRSRRDGADGSGEFNFLKPLIHLLDVLRAGEAIVTASSSSNEHLEPARPQYDPPKRVSIEPGTACALYEHIPFRDNGFFNRSIQILEAVDWAGPFYVAQFKLICFWLFSGFLSILAGL